jgi:uncharacterized protein YecE (DUF72 family)
MEFGKLSDIANIDFLLPPDRPENEAVLREGLARRSAGFLPRVYVGCTGWSMKEWVGWVYPKGCKSTDYLQYYSRQFNTIEMNTTHYRTPSVSDVQKWKRESAADFRFAPKMLQTVSHAKNLGYGTGLTTQFCDAIQHFEEKLGVCFMQMPPHFRFADVAIFEKYIARFPKSVPLAIEIRHEEWFSTSPYFNHFFDILEKNSVSPVICDVAGRRDVLHMRLTTPSVVVRFVGNDLHPTDYQRIDDWVLRLKSWFEAGLEEVYFFTHEPDNLNAPRLARYFVDKIEASFEASVRAPTFYDEVVVPVQASLFDL